MKINFFHLLPIVFITLFSCTENSTEKQDQSDNKEKQKAVIEDQLSQQWQLVNIITDAKEMDQKLDSIYQVQMNQIIDGSYILFTNEGRFSEQIIEQHRKGAWTLDDDLKTLHLEFPNSEEDWQIISLTKDTIRLQARAKNGLLVEFTAVPAKK